MYLIFEMLSSSKKTEINDSLEMKYSCWVLTLLDIWFEADFNGKEYFYELHFVKLVLL